MKKQCFKCKLYKDIHLFYKHPEMTDGHVNKCKKCNKKDVQENYRKRFEQYQIYERNRYKDPERKKKMYLYNLKRKEKNPRKYKSRYKVSNAVRAKKITRKPCEVCGEIKVQAHHSDYRKPLDVKWLCFKHHREQHD